MSEGQGAHAGPSSSSSPSSSSTPQPLNDSIQPPSPVSKDADDDEPLARAVTPPPRRRPLRKRRLPSGTDSPRSILKPSPPPAKPFSFRRDIIQTLNTRLAQQGVNVQVPIPQAGTAQGAANLLGGMFKRAVGAAGAALAGTTGVDGATPPATTPAAPPPAPAADPAPPTPSSSSPLKRVQFTVSTMSVVYPISSSIPIQDEDDTRRRIEALHRAALKERKQRTWTPAELEALYRECCRVREELPLKRMRLVFQDAGSAVKSIDLSSLPLDRGAVDPIADLLSVDFGLSKLVLENCGLTDETLKAVLHALLVSGTLPSLSLASNRRIRYNGWRLVGAFMKRATALRYLDLSENSMNKASLECLAEAIRKPHETVLRQSGGEKGAADVKAAAADESRQSLAPFDGGDEEDVEPLMPSAPLLRNASATSTEDASAPASTSAASSSSLTSLRLENCGLRGPPTLAALAQAVRSSDLKHISLRRNRINQMGAVALAVILKDYPDALPATEGAEPAVAAPMPVRSASPTLPEILPPQDSAHNGSNGLVSSQELSKPVEPTPPLDDATRAAHALSQAKRAKRILSSLPRLGSLVTLDLKSNDLRGGGASALAAALRKNRTLRVLNLSDNGIDLHGLVALAEALKYNSTLETLDVSHNPCAGPGLEGIETLRMAFALNSNLKRLFLNNTSLSSAGAIAIAEFLPEARSLLHLDLTENFDIDIAGVMALAVSLRMNKSLRCLDLNIPPNDPDFARLSQEILQSCIRNTQNAQRRAASRGHHAPIAAPIYKSLVARVAREKDERQRAVERAREAAAEKQRDKARSNEELVESAKQCSGILRELLTAERGRRGEEEQEERGERAGEREGDDEFVQDLVAQSERLRKRLAKLVQAGAATKQEGESGPASAPTLLSRALEANDELQAVTDELVAFFAGNAARSPAAAPTPGQDEEQTIATGLPSTAPGDELANSDAEEDPSSPPSGAKAEREVDPELSRARSTSPTAPEERAKSMVDEEGEIFKRARALLAAGEEEEEVERNDEEKVSANAPAAKEDTSARDASPDSGRSSSPTRRRSGSSEHDREMSADHEAQALADVDTSGEDLRQRLLAAGTPEAQLAS